MTRIRPTAGAADRGLPEWLHALLERDGVEFYRHGGELVHFVLSKPTALFPHGRMALVIITAKWLTDALRSLAQLHGTDIAESREDLALRYLRWAGRRRGLVAIAGKA